METHTFTVEEVEAKLQSATELVTDADGQVITREEFHQRLEEEYNVEIEVEDGTTHYRGGAREDETDEDKQDITDVPMSLCQEAIAKTKRPDQIITDPEEYVDKMNSFSEAVNAEFERQMDEQDDPFPLSYPPKEPDR